METDDFSRKGSYRSLDTEVSPLDFQQDRALVENVNRNILKLSSSQR